MSHAPAEANDRGRGAALADDGHETLRKTNRVLVASAIGLLCLATVLVGWLLLQSYRRYQDAAAQTAQNAAINLEYFLNAHFESSDLALQSAAAEFEQLDASGKFTPQRFTDYLVSLKQRLPNALSIRGTDSDGNIVYGDDVGRGHVSIKGTVGQPFRIAQDEGRLVIGPPLKSLLTGDWLFSIMRPIYHHDGEFAGVAYVNTSTQNIEQLFSQLNVGEHGVIALVGDDKTLIVRYPPLPHELAANGKAIQSQDEASETLQALGEHTSGSIARVQSTFDGYWRVVASRRVGVYPAHVLIGLAEKDFLAPWRRECLLGLGFLVVFAIGGAFLGIGVRRYMMARLQLQTLEETRSAHDRMSALIRAIPDLLFEVDREGRYLDHHAASIDLPGVASADLIGRTVDEVLPVPAADALMMAVAEADTEGHSYGVQMHLDTLDGEVCYELSVARREAGRLKDKSFIVLARDVTERNQAQLRIEQLAFSDTLTGLPNRRLFLDRLRQSMAVSERNRNWCALLFLDIDKFKALNDTLGHQIGDVLLAQIAERLRRAVREYDTVARLGGDEFVVLLEQLGTQEESAAAQARQVAEKVSTHLRREYDLDGHKYLGSSSIGIAMFRGQEVVSDELLRRADFAMYEAKSGSQNAVCFFDPQMQANIAARLALEIDLKQAIIHQEFFLCFQPQVDEDGTLVGAEALIRWNCPKRGLVSPADFIPLAEETGLILPIGHWVMRETCRCLEEWSHHDCFKGISVSVNVSARQVGLPTFVEEVQELLSFYDIEPSRLKLEITESMLMDHIDETVAKINALRAIGVRFSLDDFGTGYSSLSYLRRLPLDQVKIDQSFAHGALDDANDAAICRSIILLGRTLGLDVLAEGIETVEQWRFFTSEGCRYGQGYLFGKPIPRDEFEQRFSGAAAPIIAP